MKQLRLAPWSIILAAVIGWLATIGAAWLAGWVTGWSGALSWQKIRLANAFMPLILASLALLNVLVRRRQTKRDT